MAVKAAMVNTSCRSHNSSSLMSEKSSYGQILKSSFIMGGASAVNMLIGMVRTKFAAILIGTSGVGLLASFTAIHGFMGTIAGLGIQSSAVREVAAAVSKGDEQAIGRAVLTLRRTCWLTGLAGLLGIALMAPLISQLTFGSKDYTFDIAALGLIVLMANISGGQIALIQGMRRIVDLAKAQMIGAAFGAIAAIGIYYFLGIRGVMPSLIVIAFIVLLISWRFAKRVPAPRVELSWKRTFTEAGEMVKLGLVFMWNSLLISAVSYFTITLISQQINLEAVGIYAAAFALSGILVNFVLQAMGSDYYPRLTAVAEDKEAVNRLVNEQTEIGLLLAVPGLLTTMALAPWLIRIFYSQEFLPAVELMEWFILGCLGRVISWPLGFVMLALGKGKWYLLTETSFNLLHVLFIALGMLSFGLIGVAVSFAFLYLGYSIGVYAVARKLTNFHWSTESLRIGGLLIGAMLLAFLIVMHFPLWPATFTSGVLTFITTLYCLRQLVQRIGEHHRVARIALGIPGLRTVCGL